MTNSPSKTKIEDTKSENATNETLKEIQGMVDVVKGDTEVSGRVMRIDEKMMDARKEGRLENFVGLIKKKLEKGQSVEQIAEDLLEDKKVIENLIDAHLSN